MGAEKVLNSELGVKQFKLIRLSCQVKQEDLTEEERFDFGVSELIKMFIDVFQQCLQIERVEYLANLP